MRIHLIRKKKQMPKLYIANGLGFSKLGRTYVLDKIVEAVKVMGFDIIEPFADNNELSLEISRTIESELEIAKRDMDGVRQSDGVLCIISSPIPDEGSMIEVGAAMVLNKPVFYFNDDFRYKTNTEALPLNLMLFTHTTVETWDRYYYTSIEDLSSPNKALFNLISQSINCEC